MIAICIARMQVPFGATEYPNRNANKTNNEIMIINSNLKQTLFSMIKYFKCIRTEAYTHRGACTFSNREKKPTWRLCSRFRFLFFAVRDLDVRSSTKQSQIAGPFFFFLHLLLVHAIAKCIRTAKNWNEMRAAIKCDLKTWHKQVGVVENKWFYLFLCCIHSRLSGKNTT